MSSLSFIGFNYYLMNDAPNRKAHKDSDERTETMETLIKSRSQNAHIEKNARNCRNVYLISASLSKLN